LSTWPDSSSFAANQKNKTLPQREIGANNQGGTGSVSHDRRFGELALPDESVTGIPFPVPCGEGF